VVQISTQRLITLLNTLLYVTIPALSSNFWDSTKIRHSRFPHSFLFTVYGYSVIQCDITFSNEEVCLIKLRNDFVQIEAK
jgi:hypothetical protein